MLSTPIRNTLAWSVHLFTAFSAFFGLLSLDALYHKMYIDSLWYMGAAFAIDNIDGSLARLANVRRYATQIDGALLDNVIDFFTYAMVPAAFLIATDLVAAPYKIFAVALICFASCYQFSQRNAKTSDHFFKGFPSYWNILIFYAYCWHLPQVLVLWLIICCFVGSFIPIKYVYPSRMQYLTQSKIYIFLMFLATLVWFGCAVTTLALYPQHNMFVGFYTLAYILLYFFLSLYRTFCPLDSMSQTTK